MARPGQRDLRKERFWRRMLKRWQRSHLSIRDYCKLHRLSEQSFYAWRQTIAQRDREAPPTRKLSRTGTARRRNETPAFLPVQVVPSSSTATPTTAIDIVLGNGRVIRVTSGFDSVTLQRLLATLEDRPC